MVLVLLPSCQRISPLGLTLWIDQNTFATNLLEKVFKKKDLNLYTLPKALDFAYLIEDLKPELLVLDFLTVSQNLEKFKEEYLSSPAISELPVVMIDGDLDFVKNKIGEIKRPFDPFLIPARLESFFKTE
jgi:hypothetical protein